MKQQTGYSLAIPILAFALLVLFALGPSKKCDCYGETVFVLDSLDQLQINRRANELLIQGDSTTGYLLKKVLMSKNDR